MKRKFTILMLCLAMIFVCSCQNGGSDDLASGPSLVSVSFDISSYGPSYAVSVTGGRGTVSTVYYKADPEWTDGDAYGKVTEWAQADSFSNTSGTLGLFQQGQWKFDIEVRSANGAVLYTGTKTAYVNASGTPVEFDVEPAFDDTMKGKITVDVTANRVVASGDKLVITYGPTSNRASGTTINADPNGSSSTATVADFDVQTINNLVAGTYWVKLEYKNGDNTVGAAALDVTVDGGETAAITGTLDYGLFQNASLSVNGLAVLELTLVAKNNSDAAVIQIAKNQTVTFTCTATPADGAAYQWYINGALMPGNEATYSWTPSAAQFANIACSVTSGKIAKSISMDFTVTD